MLRQGLKSALISTGSKSASRAPFKMSISGRTSYLFNVFFQHFGCVFVSVNLQVLVDQQQQNRVLVRAHLDRLTVPRIRVAAGMFVINTSAHARDPARATTPPSHCDMGNGVFFCNIAGSLQNALKVGVFLRLTEFGFVKNYIYNKNMKITRVYFILF